MLNSMDRTSVRPGWLLVTLAVGVAAGYLMDKGGSDTPVPTVAAARSATPATSPRTQSPGVWSSPFSPFSSSSSSSSASSSLQANGAAAAAPADPRPSASAGEVLTALERLAPGTDMVDVERLADLLSQGMQGDEGLRRRVLAAYLKAPNEAASMGLAMALNTVEGPDMAQAALDASGPQRSQPQRLAALQLLTNSNVELPTTRDRLRASLSNGTVTDPALVAETLSALRPRGPVTVAEQAEMQTVARPYLRSPDAAVRQRAVDTITAWALREPATVEILKAAVLDPSPEVRASAVSAYARSAASPAEAREVLLGRMADEREVMAVRRAAAIALGDIPMDAATASAYEKFKASHLGQP